MSRTVHRHRAEPVRPSDLSVVTGAMVGGMAFAALLLVLLVAQLLTAVL